MQIKKIVVGTDFSEQAEVALDQALDIARAQDAEIVLVHAGTVPQAMEGIPASMSTTAAHFHELLEEQLAHDRSQLEELRERSGAGGVRVSHMVIDAFPDAGVAKAATELNADLTVVGTHGRTGFDRFLMGSVAERTARLSKNCVLVARPTKHSAGGYKRILVPTDFSTFANDAFELAQQLVAGDGEIHLLHCWELPGANWLTQDVRDAKGGSLRERMVAEATDAADTLLRARKAAQTVRVTFHQKEHSAADGIQTVLDDGNFDLVVMGSHGRRGVRRLLLGSVAEQTVRYAPCSVCIVHVATAAPTQEPT